MKITFLGTGTSQGVPFIGCECIVCQSKDQKDNRLRCSVHIEIDGKSFIIDTGPDFRQQVLRASVKHIDAILVTHSHKDHIAGMDDIRAYNHWQHGAIDVHCSPVTLEGLKREFYYIFTEEKYPGIPEVAIYTFENNPFLAAGIPIIPIRAMHLNMEVYGFRIGDFTYLTDANYLADEELEKIKGSKVFVVNALRREPHISHFSLEEAVALAEKVNAETTYFTHISHQLGLHESVEKELPPHIRLAYDGLVINL